MKECRGRRGRREQVGEGAGRKPDDWTDEGREEEKKRFCEGPEEGPVSVLQVEQQLRADCILPLIAQTLRL